MNKNELISKLKDGLVTALIAAPSLSMIIISAAYQLLASESTGNVKGLPSVLMACLVMVTLAASMILAVVYRREAVTLVFSVLFGLSFICYLAFTVSGTTDLADDSFFEMLMLILSLPMMSFVAIPSSMGLKGNVPVLVIAGLLCVVSVFLTVYIRKKAEKEQAKGAEEIKAEKPDSCRRKIR